VTDLVTVALIASVPPTVAALGALTLGVLNHRQGNAIHVLVNSKMTEVVEALRVEKAKSAALETELESKE
jgi:hypothetical protein